MKRKDETASSAGHAKPKKAEKPTLYLGSEPDSQKAAIARIAIDPVASNAITAEQFPLLGKDDVDLTAHVAALRKQTESVHEGKTTGAETMLVAQAHTLDAIFTSLARRAATNMGGGYLEASDTYMRLALRAQTQCRATWEAVSAIKNPPNIAFVRQANIAHGPQQVNNANVARGKTEKTPIELLEAPHAKPEWLDTRTAGTAGAGNSPLETVAEVHRTEDADRQGRGEP